MIPKSISYIRYINDGAYLTIMWALILIQLVEGFYLDSFWLLGGAAWAYGVQFADKYRDHEALAYGHYTYAVGLFIFWLGATGWQWSILLLSCVPTAVSVLVWLLNRRLNTVLLTFELTLFTLLQYKLWM